MLEDVASDYKELMEKLNSEVQARVHVALRLRKDQRMQAYQRKRTQGGAFKPKGPTKSDKPGIPSLKIPISPGAKKIPFGGKIALV